MRLRLRTLFLLMSVASLALTGYHFWPIDGIVGSLFAIVSDDDTVWADGYSNEAFRAVHVGMKRDAVWRLLGPPLVAKGVDDNGDEYHLESWTLTPHDSNYHRREIKYDGDTVREKIGEYYID